MGEAFAADPSILKEIELVSKTGIYLTEVDGATFGYYNTTKERVLQSCKESLKKLHADHLDLYLIHREDPLLNPWDTAEALLQLKKEGLVSACKARHKQNKHRIHHTQIIDNLYRGQQDRNSRNKHGKQVQYPQNLFTRKVNSRKRIGCQRIHSKRSCRRNKRNQRGGQ